MQLWFLTPNRCLQHLMIGIIACLAPLHASLALAADSDGNFAVDGMGNLPCAQFASAENRKAPEVIAAIGWMDGYLSAFNQLKPDTYDLTPWQTSNMLAGAVQRVCAQHGDVRLIEAVNALIGQLAPHRMTQATPIRQLDNGGQSIVVYDGILTTLRDRLFQLDYLTDASTPLEDRRLFLAIGHFQADRGMAVTSLPDPQTLMAILAK